MSERKKHLTTRMMEAYPSRHSREFHAPVIASGSLDLYRHLAVKTPPVLKIIQTKHREKSAGSHYIDWNIKATLAEMALDENRVVFDIETDPFWGSVALLDHFADPLNFVPPQKKRPVAFSAKFPKTPGRYRGPVTTETMRSNQIRTLLTLAYPPMGKPSMGEPIVEHLYINVESKGEE